MANAREWSAVVAYVLGFGGSERVVPLLFAVLLESGELEIPQAEQDIRPCLLRSGVVGVRNALQLDAEDGGVIVTGHQLVQLPSLEESVQAPGCGSS